MFVRRGIKHCASVIDDSIYLGKYDSLTNSDAYYVLIWHNVCLY